MASKFEIRLQGRILEILEHNTLTITEIAKQLGSNYHSTRKAVRNLQEAGQVTRDNSVIARDVKYHLGAQAGIDISTIPKHQGIKVNKLIELHSTTANESAGCHAIINLPRYMTKLMLAARKISKGESAELQVNVTREQMELDYSRLKGTVEIYKAILDNPANWTPEFLGRYPHDPDWDNDMLDKARDYYKKEDSDG